MSALHSHQSGDALVVQFADARIRDDDEQLHQIGQELAQIECRAVESGREKVLIDFQGVQFMCSAMVNRLLLFNKSGKKSGLKLRLCNLGPDILEVFTTLRLDRVFDIAAS